MQLFVLGKEAASEKQGRNPAQHYPSLLIIMHSITSKKILDVRKITIDIPAFWEDSDMWKARLAGLCS